MTQSIEQRLDELESQAAELSYAVEKLRSMKEVLERVHGILHDVIKDDENAEEYADDLERIDTLIRFL